MLKLLLYENSKKSKPTNEKRLKNLNNHIHYSLMHYSTPMVSKTLNNSSVPQVAPKIPPSVLIISILAVCKTSAVAAQASVTSKQSYPLSAASLIVVWTQMSVHTPQNIKFLTPRTFNNNSKSVYANVPLVGLSIIGSLGRGYSSGMISHPFSPRMRSLPSGPGSPRPIPWGLLRLRKSSRAGIVERSGRCPSRV